MTLQAPTRFLTVLAVASVLGWLFICAGVRRFAYSIGSLLAALLSLALEIREAEPAEVAEPAVVDGDILA